MITAASQPRRRRRGGVSARARELAALVARSTGMMARPSCSSLLYRLSVLLLAASAVGETSAPLVCQQPAEHRFVAVAWSNTCMCPAPPDNFCDMSLCGAGSANATCRTYDNLIPLAILRGSWGPPCNPAAWAGHFTYECQAQQSNFGTFANYSVPCAIDPSSATCIAHSPPGGARGGILQSGTADQPPGHRYLNPGILGGNNHPLMTHPKDALPDSAACTAPLAHPHHGAPYRIHRPFTGLWWDHAAAALAEQGRLFWPAYAAAGGQVDELVVDWEEGMYGPHFAGSCPTAENATAAGRAATIACSLCAAQRYDIIQADPRWPVALAQLRKLAPDFELVNGSLGDTMAPYHCVSSDDAPLRAGLPSCSAQDGLAYNGSANHAAVWHAFIIERGARYFAQALLPPARKQFPHVKLSSYNLYAYPIEQHSCEAPTASGFFNCGVGGGATALSIGAPLYYDEWVDFDCRHILPPTWRGRADTEAYCSGEAGVSRGLAHLHKTTNGRRGIASLNFTGFNIVRVVVYVSASCYCWLSISKPLSGVCCTSCGAAGERVCLSFSSARTSQPHSR